MNIISARHYVSPRSRPLNEYEQETRQIAHRIKTDVCSDEVLRTAGSEMASLIDGPCVLIPVPSHTGDTSANLSLCRTIADIVGCKINDILTREHAVEAQHERHRKKLGGIRPEAHYIQQKGKKKYYNISIPVYCVDNVTTSGNTLEACRMAVPIAQGLVFADAWDTLKVGRL